MTKINLATALTLALCCTLAGCSDIKSAAENATKERLKDPESATFGALYINEKTGAGCLTVNAKNALGGYVGDQQAFLTIKNDNVEVVDIMDLSESVCKDIADRWDPDNV